MSGTPKRLAGPAYIASSAADIYTPPASTMYIVITHIHVANKDSSARTFTLYVGGTAGSTGGTEIFKDVSIAIAGYVDYYPMMVMKSTDFLSGIASSANALVIVVEGEQYVTP